MSESALRKRPGLFTLIRKDARNRAFRTAASGGAVAAVVGALFITMLLTSGASYSTQLIRDKLGADIMILPGGVTVSPQPFYTLLYTPGTPYSTPSPIYMSDSYVQAVRSIPGVKETAGELYVTYFIVVGGGGYGNKFWVVAVDSSNFMLRSWLPQNISRPLGEGEAVLGWEFPRFSDMPNHGAFYGTKVAPIFRLPQTGTFMDRVMFISMDTAKDMLAWQKLGIDPGPCCNWEIPISFADGQISAVFVKGDEGINPDQVASQIQSTYQQVHAITMNSIVGSANERLGELLSTSSISGSLVWVASVLLVSAVTSATTNERSREFGLIRVLGANRSFIGKLVATQTILITTIAGMIGIACAWILFNAFYVEIISTLGIPYQIPPFKELLSLVAVAIVSAVAIGVLAAIWPALRASRLDPYDVARRASR